MLEPEEDAFEGNDGSGLIQEISSSKAEDTAAAAAAVVSESITTEPIAKEYTTKQATYNFRDTKDLIFLMF